MAVSFEDVVAAHNRMAGKLHTTQVRPAARSTPPFLVHQYCHHHHIIPPAPRSILSTLIIITITPHTVDHAARTSVICAQSGDARMGTHAYCCHPNTYTETSPHSLILYFSKSFISKGTEK